MRGTGGPAGHRWRLIANPAAGRNARESIDRAQNWLRRRGVDLETTLTTGPDDARRAAAACRRGYARVVAAGGDGTLNEVVNGLAPSPVPVAFLPLGTTNVFALETGIPLSIEAACRVAVEGEVRPVSLGRVDDTRFLLMASAGLDAEAVCRVRPALKRRLGKGAYLASALATLVRHRPRPITARLENGEKLCCYGAVASNGRLYGGRFVVAPQASLEEPQLDVCLLLKPGRLALLRQAAALAMGREPGPGLVRRFKARRLELGGEEVWLQIDGDHFGPLPVELAVAGDWLRMVLPAKGGE